MRACRSRNSPYIAARSTRLSANSRHVPHPSPAPSRSATCSANEAESSVAASEANTAAASTRSRSVTQLQRQTYTARPIRLDRGRMVNGNDWNLQPPLEISQATGVSAEFAACCQSVCRTVRIADANRLYSGSGTVIPRCLMIDADSCSKPEESTNAEDRHCTDSSAMSFAAATDIGRTLPEPLP